MATPTQPLMQGVQFDPGKLVDIQLPDTIAFWPVAPGWWILLGIIVVILLLVIYLIKRKPTVPAPTSKELKSQAMVELDSIKKHYESQKPSLSGKELNAHTHKIVKKLSIFLRRYALSLYQRDDVASLTNEQWLILLDKLIAEQTDSSFSSEIKHGPFTNQFSELLTQVPYQSDQKAIDEQQLDDLLATSEELINNSFKRFTPSKLEAKEHIKTKEVEKMEHNHV